MHWAGQLGRWVMEGGYLQTWDDVVSSHLWFPKRCTIDGVYMHEKHAHWYSE